MRLLCLTDHSSHSKENSVYHLLRAFAKDIRFREVWAASRGIEKNDSFFNGRDLSKISAIQVNEDFAYHDQESIFNRSIPTVSPDHFDLIMMRLPRPIADSYLLKLKNYFRNQVFINDPVGIVRTSNKKFLLSFKELCPPMQLCKSIEEVLAFGKDQEIVLKPLRAYGGKGILRVDGNRLMDGTSVFDTVPYLNGQKEEWKAGGYLAMHFLQRVGEGDKRLIVVGGKILAASLRLPPEGSWLCNVALGGTSVATEPDLDEIAMVNKINPLLEANGIFIYGVDTLVGNEGHRVLSEINTLSIGGFPQAEIQTGQPIIQDTVNRVYKYAMKVMYGGSKTN